MMTISAPATTATVAAIAVTRKTPTRRCRGRRRTRERARAVAGVAGAPAAGERLRCCDNAVLPSAKRHRVRHPERGPLRYKGSESHDGRLARAFLALEPRALICLQDRRRITLPEPAPPTKRFHRKSKQEYEEL